MLSIQHYPEDVKEERFLWAIYHYFRFKGKCGLNPVHAANASIAPSFRTNGGSQWQGPGPSSTTESTAISKAPPSEDPKRAEKKTSADESRKMPVLAFENSSDVANTLASMNNALESPTKQQANATPSPHTDHHVPEHVKYQKVASVLLQEFPYLEHVHAFEQTMWPDVYQRYYDAPLFYSQLQDQTRRALGLEEQLRKRRAEQTAVAVDIASPSKRPRNSQDCTKYRDGIPPTESTAVPLIPAQITEVKLSMQVSRRKDVPPDVKKLVSELRASFRNDKKVLKNVIQKLETTVSQTKQELKEVEKSKEELEQQSSKPAARAGFKQPPSSTASTHLKPPPSSELPPTPPPPVTFDQRFAELTLFQKANGHANVTGSQYRGPSLGSWAASLRQDYRHCMRNAPQLLDGSMTRWMGNSTLNRERIERLETLGFVMDFGKVTLPWEERFKQLCEFKERFGHTKVTRKWKENPSLGEWCHLMRKTIRKDKLSEDKVEKFAAVGFSWEAQVSIKTFDERLEQCRAFRFAHGHLDIPRPPQFNGTTYKSLSKEDANFRQWASKMRQESNKLDVGQKASIDRRQRRQLEALGLDFEKRRPGKSPGTKKTDGSGCPEQELEEACVGAVSGDLESLDSASV
jgi:hypothetical protein